MHVLPALSGEHCVFEDDDGAIYTDGAFLIGWLVDDDGSVTPLTGEGPQREAVGYQSHKASIELFGVGVFATFGEALIAWEERDDSNA